MRNLSIIFICLALFTSHDASAEERSAQSPDAWLRSSLRVLLSGAVQDPAYSTQNPDNAFLKLPRYDATLALRPDFFIETTWVNGTFKPRAIATETWRRDGAPAGMRDREARFFVNEWLIQPKVHDNLVLSLGKEKLLWGPSFLVSPSNILFKDAEKVNPKAEVEGNYLARAVWMPNPAITVTAISETRRRDSLLFGKEKPFRAVKIDAMGGSAMASVIGYARQNGRLRLGSFGQWTVSDGLLLYYDGMVTRGTDALYPVKDTAHPLGGAFQRSYEHADRLFTTVAAGGSHTYLSGETFSVEFLYNGAGYGAAEAAEYYRLRRTGSDHFYDSGITGQLAALTLAETSATGSDFLRRYYLMTQVQTREIGSVLTIIMRYTHGIEERAGRASSIVEWKLSDRLRLYNVNAAAIDRGREQEFNALMNKSCLLGLEASW